MISRAYKPVLGLFLIISILAYLISHTDLIDSFGRVSAKDMGGLIALSTLVLLLLGVQFKTLSSVFFIHLRFSEWFGLTAINTMLNLAIPAKAGLLFRGIYLKKNHQFPFSKYTKLALSSHLLMIIIIALLGLVLLISVPAINTSVKQLLALFFISIIFAIIAVILFAPKLIKKFNQRWMQTTLHFFDIVPILSQASKKTWLIYILTLITINLLWAIKLFYCFKILGSAPEFSHVLLIQCLISLSFVVSITPGNIGIKEAITALGAGLLGLSTETALIASLIDRATAMLVIFFFGVLSTHYLTNHQASSTP